MEPTSTKAFQQEMRRQTLQTEFRKDKYEKKIDQKDSSQHKEYR
jgi:hypothetical protein